MDSVESGLPGSSNPPVPASGTGYSSTRTGSDGPSGYSSSTRTGHPAELIYVEDPVYYKFQDNEKSYKGMMFFFSSEATLLTYVRQSVCMYVCNILGP